MERFLLSSYQQVVCLWGKDLTLPTAGVEGHKMEQYMTTKLVDGDLTTTKRDSAILWIVLWGLVKCREPVPHPVLGRCCGGWVVAPCSSKFQLLRVTKSN